MIEEQWYAEILSAFKKQEEIMKTWTKEEAFAYLVKLGIYNSDGTLHENYGGKRNEIQT